MLQLTVEPCVEHWFALRQWQCVFFSKIPIDRNCTFEIFGGTWSVVESLVGGSCNKDKDAI